LSAPLLDDRLDSESDSGSSSIMLKSSTKAGGDRVEAPGDDPTRDEEINAGEVRLLDEDVDDGRLLVLLEGRWPR
jgi:hypothetical protein